MIETATNTVVATIPGNSPRGVAFTPDGSYAYVTNFTSNSVSVIDTALYKVVANVEVGSDPVGVAITADGAYAFVANSTAHTVSVIDTATLSVVRTIPVGLFPSGVAIKP